MDCYIAIDGGGTKTETILFDAGGHILCRHVTTGCNVLDLGVEASGALILKSVDAACIKGARPAAVFAGIAANCHCGDRLYLKLKSGLGDIPLEVWDDAYSVISSVVGHLDGCGLVAGTGSSLFVRSENLYTHIGGWGYLLDTGGSGYDIGRKAVYAALRASDGRGRETMLNGLLEKELGKSVAEAVSDIYAGGRPFIASLAHMVFEGRNLGDAVCTEIFESEASHLAEMVNSAYKYYGRAYDVVLGGGLFTAYPEYVGRLMDLVRPEARLLATDMPVVYGACVEAMRMAGVPAAEDFRAAFMNDYCRLTGRD